MRRKDQGRKEERGGEERGGEERKSDLFILAYCLFYLFQDLVRVENVGYTLVLGNQLFKFHFLSSSID